MKPDLKNIQPNIFSGFVVSLIALPLALGLALASGAPPISGIIASVVGGILTAVLGGSKVTITGPGNGLVVVTLTAITALGGGDMYQGYLYTLGAIVISGALVFAFGLLRFGFLSDFFPSAAVQGMLAAIGIIIMAKQLHVMLGEVNPEADTTVGYFVTLPASFSSIARGEIPALAYTIGLISLAIMLLYARVHNRYLHLIPAPMWIVLIGIGLVYFSSEYPHILTPLGPEYLVRIPDNMISSLAFPDFGMWMSSEFWMAVITLTLIASVESLLSIKAVDRIDPLRRRSNVNKDLRALGLATIVSGFAGGLNVVTVIARSSVNVNQGAKNQWSNFFHGFFLLVFVLLFTSALQHIPLPALAAILVFTGYRLAEPAVFRKMIKVGWEQLAIFMITMLVTVFTDLISGIAVGILVSLLFQLRQLPRLKLFLRYTVRPNSLLYREADQQFHLSVKGYSSFVNFLGLKKKLDTLPPQSNVIVDFSLAEFVDHSVMEQLDNYYKTFRSQGGDLEIIGLDDLGSYSRHPLATRQVLHKAEASRTDLSRRQKGLRLFCKKLGWKFHPREFYDETSMFTHFKFFETKLVDKGRNRVFGKVGDIEVHLADLDYHEGEFIARESNHSTMVALHCPEPLPHFVMNKENLLDRVAYLAGFNDIYFAKHPDFSKNFKVKGKKDHDLYLFFDDDVIEFFQSNKAFHVESDGRDLLIFEKERISTLSEIKQLVSFASRLATLLNQKLVSECLD